MFLLVSVDIVSAAQNGNRKEVSIQNRRDLENIISENNTEIIGTNSVGNLISNTLQKEDVDTNQTCFINEISIEGKIATIEYQTDRDSEIVVAVYTEDGVQMLFSGHVFVSSEDTIAAVVIETDSMPEYFLATAYLMDAETHEPLSKEHTTRLYTREMQEFLSKTVEDFPQDLVLNLDEDKTTNFAVYGEETVVIEEAAQAKKNHVQENGDGTYTITNADSLVTNLKEGNSLAYEYADGSVLAVKIAKVTVKGSTVTIQEDTQAELADIFDYVKIENDGTDNEVTVDNSNLEDGVTPIEKVAEATINQSGQSIRTSLYPSFLQVGLDQQTPKVGVRAISASESVKKEIKKEFYQIKDEWKSKNSGSPSKSRVKISTEGSFECKVGVGVTASVNIYISRKNQYIKFRIDAETSFEVSASGEADLSVALGRFDIPICTGVFVSFTPSFICEFKGELSLEINLKAALGFMWDDESGWQKILEKPTMEDSGLKIEATIFLGLSLEPKLVILDDKIASAFLTAEFGFELSGKNNVIKENDTVRHDCGTVGCIGGEISVKIDLSAGVTFVKNKKITVTLFKEIYKLTDWHYSIVKNDFGFSVCPYYAYQVKVTVTDESGNPFPNATINGTGLEIAPVTDEKGTAVFCLYNGKYSLWIGNEKEKVTKNIEMKSHPKELEISMLDAVIASGDCGEQLKWELRKSGMLTVTGKGEMTEWKYTAEIPWYQYRSKIQEVVIENGVTTVSDFSFNYYSAIKNVTIGKDVKYIGREAFKFCNIETLKIDCNTEIETNAFSRCSYSILEIGKHVTNLDKGFYHNDFLKEINVDTENKFYSSVNGVLYNSERTMLIKYPSKNERIDYETLDAVKTIQAYAFNNCEKLEEITLGKSVKKIESHAFYHSHMKILNVDCDAEVGGWAFYLPKSDYAMILNIGEHVTKLDEKLYLNMETHSDCSELLSEINVDSKNQFYSSVDGVLYNKTQTQIVRYPQKKEVNQYQIPDTVQSIEKGAFKGCSNLKEIVVPDSVTEIGEQAFYDCHDLETVTIGKSVTGIGSKAFDRCNIRVLNIDYNAEVEKDVFMHIEILNVGEHVTNIQDDLDDVYTTYIEEINVDDKNEVYSSSDGVLYDKEKTRLIRYPVQKEGENYQIFDTVTVIEKGAFAYCYHLKDVTIPDGVFLIQEEAFRGCSLKEMIIPDSVIEIGEKAFIYCHFETVTLGSGLVKIGSEAFYYGEIQTINIDSNIKLDSPIFCAYDSVDNYMKTWNIGKHVTDLDESFYGDFYGYYYRCREKINVDEENQFYSSQDGVLYDKNKTKLLKYPEKKKESRYQIPDTVTNIAGNAFYRCYDLEEIIIPDSVTEIGYGAFYGCNGIETIIMGKNVTTIGGYAFFDCDIKDIYYAGSEAEWEKLLICEFTVGSWNANGVWGDSLRETTIHYSSTISDSPAKSIKKNALSLQLLPEQEWEFVTETEPVSEAEDAFVTEESEVTSIDEPQSLPEESIESMTESEDIFVEENFAEDIVPETTPVAEGMELSYTTGVTDHSTERMNPMFMQSKSDIQIEDLSAGLDALVQSAIYYGTVTSEDGRQSAEFAGLVAGAEYIMVIVQDEYAEQLFSSENLLYIAQGVADEEGYLSFTYIPKRNEGTAVVYGMSNQNLSDAEITLSKEIYVYDGTPKYPEVTVYYDGVLLTEDEDYVLSYVDNVESGVATVTITGRADYAGVVTKQFTIGEAAGVSLTGTITSYGTQNTPASIVLLNGTEEVARVESTDDTYTLPSVSTGTYTMEVSKENHVTRTYDITVESEDVTQDVKLCLIGDVTGDGKVNTRDLNRLYAHVNGTNPLEGYEFACGDVTGDDKINTRDLNRLYAHISESNRLW